ncbi:MAG: hypothetical protein C5B46_03735 [Proteobacteria bacterium]|nr:MAG: hypothetical protein C5B46_03735 [Pseudomonadota bacterium]
MIKQRIVQGIGPLLAAVVMGLSQLVAAAEDDRPDVKVDWSSFERSGDLARLRVTATFPEMITLGHGTYAHRSQKLQYAIDCAERSYALEQWSLTDSVDGSGNVVWQDHAAKLDFTRGDKGTLEAALVVAACGINPTSTVARNPSDAAPVQ